MNKENRTLQDMGIDELRDILKVLEISFQNKDTEDVLRKKIKESGKYDDKTSGISIKGKVVNGVKTHPTFGRYYDVIVRPIKPEDQNTSIFVSINAYTVDFQPGAKVSLPKDIIKFLKGAITPEHYYDPNAMSENGNRGMHKTRYVPKYIVEKAHDEF